jgi:hypothetical protein
MKILQANLIKLVCVCSIAYSLSLAVFANNNFRPIFNLNTDSKQQLLINEQTLIDSHNFKLEFSMNAEELLLRTSFPQQVKVKAYTLSSSSNEESIVTIINSSFYNIRQARNFSFSIELPSNFPSQDLYFDIFDSEGKLSASFKEFIKTPNEVVYERALQEANCDPNSFGDCQIKYLLNSLNFVAIANRNRETVITQEDSGKYTIGLPLMRVNNMRVHNHYTSPNSSSEAETVNPITVQNPEALAQAASNVYSFVSEGLRKASLVWNNSVNAIEVFFAGDKASKFSFTRDGTFHTGKLKLNSDQGLSINPEDGLIEFDGDKLYITQKGARQEFFRQGLQGPPGPPGQAGRPGRDGSFSGGDADVNGTLSFLSTGKLTNAVLDGSLAYTTGAQNGYVLMSDDNGNASWASIGSVINGSGASFGASAHGTAGAIQFSDGASGLSSNADALYWDNNNSTLSIDGKFYSSTIMNSPTDRIIGADVERGDSAAGHFLSIVGTGNWGGNNTPLLRYTPSSGLFELCDIWGGASIRLGNPSWGGNIAQVYGTGMVFRNSNQTNFIVANTNQFIGTQAASRVLTVRGHSAQSANLTEWLNSAGTPLTVVNPQGNVGIGTSSPTAKLDVNGSIFTTGLRLSTGAGAGKVLTSDANGVASWEDAPVGGVPYTGATDNVDLGSFRLSSSRGVFSTGTIATSQPAVNVTQTWNDAATIFTLLSGQVTPTAANATSRWLNFESTTNWGGNTQPLFRVNAYGGQIHAQGSWGEGSLRLGSTAIGALISMLYGTGLRFTVQGQNSLTLGSHGEWGTNTTFHNWHPNKSLVFEGTSSGRVTWDSHNVWHQRNGTNPQTSRLANTWTSATNFEALQSRWESDIARIGTMVGSAGGTQRNLELGNWNSAGTWSSGISVATTSNVGIGTSTPARKLHISEAMRLEPQASPPAAPSLGDLYVDSDTNELCFYNGTVWTGIVAGGACN